MVISQPFVEYQAKSLDFQLKKVSENIHRIYQTASALKAGLGEFLLRKNRALAYG